MTGSQNEALLVNFLRIIIIFNQFLICIDIQYPVQP